MEQYLLSPVQLGIPNTRLRYYCLATRRNSDTHGDVAAIQNHLPCHSVVTTAAQEENGDMPLRALSEYLVRWRMMGVATSARCTTRHVCSIKLLRFFFSHFRNPGWYFSRTLNLVEMSDIHRTCAWCRKIVSAARTALVAFFSLHCRREVEEKNYKSRLNGHPSRSVCGY